MNIFLELRQTDIIINFSLFICPCFSHLLQFWPGIKNRALVDDWSRWLLWVDAFPVT